MIFGYDNTDLKKGGLYDKNWNNHLWKVRLAGIRLEPLSLSARYDL
jgi:hypothetical protein